MSEDIREKFLQKLPEADRVFLEPREFYNSAEYVHIYYEDGIIAGFVEVKLTPYGGYIGIAIMPEYRGKGLATQLIHKAESEFSRGCKTFFWEAHKTNSVSIHLAKKCGYSYVGINPKNNEEYLFRKDVS